MLEHVNNDDTFVKRIITGDEKWVWESDVLTKQQSSEDLTMSQNQSLLYPNISIQNQGPFDYFHRLPRPSSSRISPKRSNSE